MNSNRTLRNCITVLAYIAALILFDTRIAKADVINISAGSSAAAINTALASAQNGDILLFADGSYPLAGNIDLDNATGAAITLAAANPGSVTFDGTDQAGGRSLVGTATFGANLYIDGITFDRVQINLVNATRDLYVTNCSFSDQQSTSPSLNIVKSADQAQDFTFVILNNNWNSLNTSDPVEFNISATDHHNILFQNNNIDVETITNSNDAAVRLLSTNAAGSANLTFTGNDIRGEAADLTAGLVLTGIQGSTKLYIEDNNFQNLNRAINMAFSGGNHDLWIKGHTSGNSFKGFTNSGIVLNTGGDATLDYYIGDNQFESGVTSTYGIFISHSNTSAVHSAGIIDNNEFQSCTALTTAILVSGDGSGSAASADLTLSNNTIDASANADDGFGLDILNSFEFDVDINNNSFDVGSTAYDIGNTSGDIDFEPADVDLTTYLTNNGNSNPSNNTETGTLDFVGATVDIPADVTLPSAPDVGGINVNANAPGFGSVTSEELLSIQEIATTLGGQVGIYNASAGQGQYESPFNTTGVDQSYYVVTNSDGIINAGRITFTVVDPKENSLRFDGSNDYVEIPVSGVIPTGIGTRTIELWFRRAATGAETLFAYGVNSTEQYFGLSFNGSDEIIFNGAGATNVNTGTTVTDTDWHHLAITYSGTDRTIFLDGGAIEGPTAVGLGTSASNVFVGSDVGGSGNFGGAIDEFAIWSVDRTGSITSDAENGITAGTPGLIAYFKSNQGDIDDDGTTRDNTLITQWKDEQQTVSGTFYDANLNGFALTAGADQSNFVKSLVPTTFGGLIAVLDGSNLTIPDMNTAIGQAWDTDWGQQSTSASVQKDFFVVNAGLTDITLTAITAGGNSDFTVDDQSLTSQVLAPGAQYYFNTSLTPSAGPTTETVTIAATGASNTGYLINLAGEGISAAEIAVTSPTSEDIPSGAGGSAFYGTDFKIGIDGTVTRTFTINNNGDLALANIEVTSSEANDFAIANVDVAGGINGSGSIAAGSSADITVTYQAIDDYTFGQKEATITIASTGDPDEGTFTFGMRAETVDNALNFNNIDAYLTIPNQPALNSTTITVEAWVRTTDSGLGRAIIKTNGVVQKYDLAVNMPGGTNKAAFTSSDGSNTVTVFSTTDINDGAWHHIAGTLDEGNDVISVYVDGNLEGTAAYPYTSVTSTNPVWIGDNGGGGQPWLGEIDQVRIFNSIRTIDQIRQDAYNLGDAGAFVYYSFNVGETEGDNSVTGNNITTISDESGNGNTGTFNNFTLTGNTENFVESDFSSADIIPVFYSSTPVLTNSITTTSFDIDLTLGETGQWNYVVTADGAGGITTNADVDAATNDIGATNSSAQNLPQSTTNVTVSGLVASTPYDVYIYAEDASGNEQLFVQYDVTTAAAAAPEITVNADGNVNDISDGDTTPDALDETNFGSIGENSGIVKTIEITNDGSLDLTINSITSNVSEFVIADGSTGTALDVDMFPSTISAGNTETFDIVYTPSALGTQGATITINSDDGDEAVFDFQVQATSTDNALHFDGVDDIVTTPLSIAATDDFTLEFWLLSAPTGGSDHGIMEAVSSAFGFRIRDGSGIVNFRTSATDIDGTTDVADGNWHHIALTATYDGSTDSDFELYIDGVLEATQADLLMGGGTLRLGDFSTFDNFEGEIDELRVWNTARTSAQIRQNAANVLTGAEGGLLLYYDFDFGIPGGSDNTFMLTPGNLFDQTSNNEDGTLTGFTLMAASVSNFVASGALASSIATNARIVVTDSDGNRIADGDNFDFGNVDSGLGRNAEFTITNEGFFILTLTNLTLGYTGNYASNPDPASMTLLPDASQNFTVTVTAADGANPGSVDDLTHNGLGDGTYNISFTANGTTDVTPLTLSSSVPVDDEDAVLIGDNIVLTFDDNIVENTGNIVLTGDNGFTETIPVAMADPRLTIVDNVLTINPSGLFSKGETIDVTIANDVLRDDAALAFPGIATDALDFTAVDIVINEIVNDPQTDWSTNGFDGTDGLGTVSQGVDEWVELYINTAGADLTNWTIELNDGTPTTGDLTNTGAFQTTALSAGTLSNTSADSYLVLGNVAGSGDMTLDVTVNLVDPNGDVVDAVTLSDGGNPDGNSTSVADEAVFRYPNGSDTDVDATDFTNGAATLGSTSETPPNVTRIEAVATTAIEIEFDEI